MQHIIILFYRPENKTSAWHRDSTCTQTSAQLSWCPAVWRADLYKINVFVHLRDLPNFNRPPGMWFSPESCHVGLSHKWVKGTSPTEAQEGEVWQSTQLHGSDSSPVTRGNTDIVHGMCQLARNPSFCKHSWLSWCSLWHFLAQTTYYHLQPCRTRKSALRSSKLSLCQSGLCAEAGSVCLPILLQRWLFCLGSVLLPLHHKQFSLKLWEQAPPWQRQRFREIPVDVLLLYVCLALV